VTAVSISKVDALPQRPGLRSVSIDEPLTGAEFATYAFDIKGRAETETERVSCVEVRQEGRLLGEAPVAPASVEAAGSAPLGEGNAFTFGTTIQATDLRTEFDLRLRVRYEGGGGDAIGRIQGRRHALPASSDVRIQPVMVTTIGRSGSKWLVWLLSCHAQIVAFQPLVFEPRVATYWVEVFRSLSAPKSSQRQIHSEDYLGEWWLGHRPGALPGAIPADFADWLGKEAVESLAAMCQGRIEAFYGRAGAAVGKPDPDYFVEKFLLRPLTLDLLTEIYPGAREVILVRDFRDRLSSVLAWNARRGQELFGRDTVTTDADFVTSRVRTEAQSLLRHWRSRKSSALLVRYEDLVLEPRRMLEELLNFLNVDSSSKAVAATLNRASQERKLLDAHRTTDQPGGSIGRWRRDLSPELAGICNEVLTPVLTEFGYSVEGTKSSRQLEPE
jgi:Sulfotransferase family